jgi:hypothetical protein
MMARTPPQLSPEPTLGERFGLNLWRSRRRADLSQEALANLVGLKPPAHRRRPLLIPADRSWVQKPSSAEDRPST